MRRLIAFLILTAFAPAAGVSAPLSPAALRQDLSIARQALEEAHGGVDRYVPRKVSRTAFERAGAALDRPMTVLEFYRILAPALFSVKDGHLSLYLSEGEERRLRNEALLLPLRIRYIGGRPFVSADLISTDGRFTGYELRAVDGMKAERITRRLIASTRGDGNVDSARLRRNEGFAFAEQLVAMIGAQAPYRLTLKDPKTGRAVTLESAGSTLPDLTKRWEAAYPGQRAPAGAFDFTLSDEGRSARMTIRSFDWHVSADGRVEMQRAIAQAFGQMAARGTRSLILDLRGNSGGHDELGRLLLAHLVDRPFRYYSDLRANALSFSFAPYVTAGARTLDPKRFEALPDGGYRFTGHPNWGEWQPVEPVFRGRLYVLIDGGSFSTTSELLTQLHWRKRGTFIGEEAAGGYYGNSSGYMSIITLPNSRLRIRMPLITYRLAAPPGYPADRGVRPDHEIAPRPEDLRSGVDRALDFTLQLLRRDGQGGGYSRTSSLSPVSKPRFRSATTASATALGGLRVAGSSPG